jgi:hypothetical protein
MGKHAVAVGFLLLFAVAASGQAPVPVGPEIDVTQDPSPLESFPSIAVDGAGRFVVVWERWESGPAPGIGIFGRRFDAAGAVLGSELQVNTYTTGDQRKPQAASSAAGTFVVVWTSYGQYGNFPTVLGRRYDAAGSAGSDFRVSMGTSGNIRNKDVAMDDAGNFVVVWEQQYSIRAQRYDASGASQGTEFTVSTITTASQRYPSVDMDPAGNFVVVWTSFASYTSYVLGRRFSAAGSPLGNELQVSGPVFTFEVGLVSVAMDADGRFVVVWTSVYPAFGPKDVVGRRFDAAGAALGDEFTINSFTTYVQRDPAVSSDAAGNFVAVWHSDFQDGHNYGVFGQAYDAAGLPAGDEFQINTYTRNDQHSAAIAASGAGTFVVAWSSGTKFAYSNDSVFAQRFLADLIFRNGFEAGN